MSNLQRTRTDLAEFLRHCRERLSPEELGLPCTSRRRTPGLRREEVAALAGVGLTWYTWLEQGREIGVSSTFLDNLARVFRLDAAERRHLYLLAQQRLPAEPGKTWCQVPPLVRRLMDDLQPHLAYVLNLRWDVLAFNPAADALFAFSRHEPARRNLLWLLFTEDAWRECLVDWQAQAALLLAGFRRNHARAEAGSDIFDLVDELLAVSPEFKVLWLRHDVLADCSQGRRCLRDPASGQVHGYEHTSLSIDDERHLRLIVHARVPEAGFTQSLPLADGD